MAQLIKPFLFILICCALVKAIDNEEKILKEGEAKLSDQIIMILEHYKQENPVGIPGVKIPDPMPIPDMKHSFSVATMMFKNLNIYGLSKFEILNIKSEISLMEVSAELVIDNLQVLGNYTMSTWLSRSQGPFVVNLSDVNVKGIANLAVERDGKLRAQDIKMDIAFSKIAMNFENLGFMGSVFQGILNSVGTFLFDSIKPFVLKEAYVSLRQEINTNLDKVAGDMRFPNSISPLDMVIADTRNKVKGMGLDPYLVKDFGSGSGNFKANLSHTWLTGISSFYRVGNISLSVENHTVVADFNIGTQQLHGQTQWDIYFMGGIMSRAGTASFSVDYISARIVLGQPLDTRKHPECRDVQLEVGNIQVRCNGAGTLDYAIEFLVNILPNLLRYQIIDAIEGPIKDKLQQTFDKLDVEEIIKQKISDGETMGESSFKLSTLKQNSYSLEHDNDSFWRFD